MSGLEPVAARLKCLFGTSQPVFALAGSAETCVELAVRSLVRRRALVVVGGPRGEQHARIVEACGHEVTRVSAQPGRALSGELLGRLLAGPAPDTIILEHTDLQSGVESPIGELARVARDRPELLVVVEVTHSIGRRTVAMDSWGVDLVFAACEGALGLAPGLAIGAASPQALNRARQIPFRGHTLDLLAHAAAAREAGTLDPISPDHLAALQARLG